MLDVEHKFFKANFKELNMLLQNIFNSFLLYGRCIIGEGYFEREVVIWWFG